VSGVTSLTANDAGRLTACASTSLLTGTRIDGKVATVEVKIGISDSPRELNFSSSQTPAEIEEQVISALAKGSDVLKFTDERGRTFLVQTAKITYVEIGVADVRRVGFAG
jgi:hypothetical protein